ncbi:peptidoglycan-binding protein [Streptomyces sp. APSN-46.1]|uniref:peptidoglycan-binding domain-containing protein n=1 Tax=Streptomyces sp. APSN-46.1 TaxID=2929049 RepID=UPI001FB2375D|nr:peptidoglycan-binding domain-containing protein [Streptomyces sp. APSN-46.1]MCJ1677536.1 peptidoglycan-binding protein [Streptomyces sp. APSN-46.1]
MSAERCPNCDAVGVGCGCVPRAGFDPLRIRPYVTLSDPGEATAPTFPQPVRGAVTPEPHPSGPPPAPGGPGGYGAQAAPGPGGYGQAGDAATELLPPVPAAPVPPQGDTPAYGIPVPPAHPAWPDETAALQTVPPAPGPAPALAQDGGWAGEQGRGEGRGGGGGGAPEGRSAPASRRRLLPLLLGAAAVVALGSGALAMGAFGDSGASDTALGDPKAAAPAASAAPAGSSQASTSPTRSPSASASRSTSPSPSASPSSSASRSASPSASPSRSSAPPSPKASAIRSPSSQAPQQQVRSLQYGDSGPEVEQLQRLLAAEGLYRGKFNGKYDDRTENAVSTFQWNNDIDEDPWGVYGPATRKALEG